MPMRVLHVLKYAHPGFSGESVFTDRLTLQLKKVAPDINHDMLATLTSTSDFDDQDATNGIDKRFFLLSNESEILTSSKKLIDWLWLHRNRYDIIHFHTHVDRTFFAYSMARKLGKRTLYTATLDDSVAGLISGYSPKYRPFARRALRRFDHFIAISPGLYQHSAPCLRKNRISHIPIGIPCPPMHEAITERAKLKTLGIPDDHQTILTVGAVCPRKAQLELVKAVANPALKARKLSLVMVGPTTHPDYQNQILDYAKAHHIQDRIILAGRRNDVDTLLREVDVFGFSSAHEGFGTAVIEAMARRVPVVAKPIEGVNEDFVIPEKTALTFETHDQLVSAIVDILDNEEKTAQRVHAAEALVREQYRMDKIAEKYLALYRA